MPELLFTLKDQLVQTGLLSDQHLAEALAKQAKTAEPLDQLLTQMGFLLEEEILEFLAKRMGVTTARLDQYTFDPNVARLIPEATARKYHVLPLFSVGKQLTLAMTNPLDLAAVQDVRQMTQCKVDRVLVSKTALLKAIDMLYGKPESLKQEVQTLFGKEIERLGEGGPTDAAATSGEVPIVKLVDLLFLRALQNRASDIHLEPDEKMFRIRYRIDGNLQEVLTLPKRLEGSILSRIKILADMDITERRLPQDGRISQTLDGKAIDFRISIINTILGEKAVIRILDKATAFRGLEALGFLPQMEEQFETVIAKIPGIILVTGPTGSGKTSTLYSVLKRINTIDRNIVTIEDPVEYHLEGVSQIQVDPKIGLTFANGLRSILRQDPDIIMIGEIRDSETAEIAIHAALTGHLVLSTLHTGNAASALPRLAEMGVKPYLTASSLTGVLAQRLVRTICQHCRTKVTPSESVLMSLGLPAREDYQFFKGKGCRNCNQSGYSGRTGIFELLTVSDEIRELITQNAAASPLEQSAKRAGMISLFEDGLAKIFTGVTTVEEVLRATSHPTLP